MLSVHPSSCILPFLLYLSIYFYSSISSTLILSYNNSYLDMSHMCCPRCCSCHWHSARAARCGCVYLLGSRVGMTWWDSYRPSNGMCACGLTSGTSWCCMEQYMVLWWRLVKRHMYSTYGITIHSLASQQFLISLILVPVLVSFLLSYSYLFSWLARPLRMSWFLVCVDGFGDLVVRVCVRGSGFRNESGGSDARGMFMSWPCQPILNHHKVTCDGNRA